VPTEAVFGGGVTALMNLRRLAARTPATNIDLVHAHGLWDGAMIAGAALADRAGCPFLASPHGMLEPWAFKHNRLKKAIPWLLWERSALARADVLEAKSELESRSFPLVGLQNAVAVIPVGLDSPPLVPAVDGRRHSPRTCLFLSRIHPKKGIDMLLAAWARVSPANWQLVIAGPDDGGYQPSLEALAGSLGIADRVRFVGPHYGERKWHLLRDADLFVLPSHSENFGIVIPEALAMGLPCIATTGTPWQALRENRLGWWVGISVDDIAQALHEAVAMPGDELAAIGARGIDYVRRTFSWDTVTHNTIHLYHDMVTS
jgi:glycosyltransferase involved in cell wall biosynthesis